MTWDFQENTDVQDGKWQVMRWEDKFTTGDGTSKMATGRLGDGEEEFTTGDGTSKMGTGRSGDGKRNLPQMGHPRWELAGRETGRGIYHRRWDIQDGNTGR